MQSIMPKQKAATDNSTEVVQDAEGTAGQTVSAETTTSASTKKNHNADTSVSAASNTNTVATHEELNIDAMLKQVNLSNPTWDLFLAGFFIIGALLYGLSLGKDRIIAIMMSIYMALAVVAALPNFVLNIKVTDSYTLQVTAFFSVFIVLFFLLSRQAVVNALSPKSQGKWWQTLIFSILHVGLLVSVTLSYLPPNMLEKFSPFTRYLFTNEWTAFAWIAAPILAMIVVGKSGDEN